MTQQRVLQFEYQQSLVQESDRPGWSEEISVSVRILSEALTSGWYRERFSGRGNDFVILLAIAMHARPLKGDDLNLLIQLGMASPDDEGRLYARVTDMGLADELGMSSKTILRATERLQDEHAISIVDIPEVNTFFRDSHGRFNGTKVYLLAGDLQSRFLVKAVEQNDRRTKSPTVEGYRGTKSPTVNAHRGTKSPDRRTKIPTNMIDEEDEEDAAALAERVFAYFADRKGDDQYHPAVKEQIALDKLLADGFTYEQIIAGIEEAFARPSRPRHFTHCAAITRDLARYQQEPPLSEPRQPDSQNAAALSQSESADDEAQVVIDAFLARAVGVYQSADREISPDLLARFRLMAGRCDAAARAADSTGADWLAEALTTGLGVAKPGNLLNYAEAVLTDWIANGRSAPVAKPPRRSRPGKNGESGVHKGIQDYIKQRGGIPNGE
jgi:hypothetical protein